METLVVDPQGFAVIKGPRIYGEDGSCQLGMPHWIGYRSLGGEQSPGGRIQVGVGHRGGSDDKRQLGHSELSADIFDQIDEIRFALGNEVAGNTIVPPPGASQSRRSRSRRRYS